MSLKISTKQTEYQPVQEGSYTAICYSIADIGQQYNERFKKTAHRVIITWEICDDDLREDFGRGKMERRAISKEYTASFNEKSNLYKDIRPWIGREFTDDFFNLADLAGKPCTISVINDKGSDGKIYANVSSVGPVVKGIRTGAPENPIVVYDIDESPEEVFLQLPEWIQKKIQASKNPNSKQANSVFITVDSETGEIIESAQSEHTNSHNREETAKETAKEGKKETMKSGKQDEKGRQLMQPDNMDSIDNNEEDVF